MLFVGRPDSFPLIHSITFPLLVSSRLYVYQKKSWHYFLFDFCYFGNVLLMLQVWLFPKDPRVFMAVFGVSAGPLFTAVIMFRNSLVFHSFDKLTSCYIHICPFLVTFTMRWSNNEKQFTVCLEEGCPISVTYLWLAPMLIYFVHQIVYGLIVQGCLRKAIESREGSLTLYKHLVADRQGVVWRALHICGHRHRLIMFSLYYVLFATLSTLPALLWYKLYAAHVAFAVLVILICINNGGSFYFSVFANDSIKAEERKPSFYISGKGKIGGQSNNKVTPSQIKGATRVPNSPENPTRNAIKS